MASRFKEGDMVQVVNLKAKKELNGVGGRVMGFDATKQRWKVDIGKGEANGLLVKEENLLTADEWLFLQRKLWEAVDAGDVPAMGVIVEKGGDVNSANQMMLTPLHRVCRQGMTERAPIAEVMEWIIEKGAKVNSEDRAGLTPLHYAATTSLDAVRVLLAHGADVKAAPETAGLRTPLHYAAMAPKGVDEAVYAALVAHGADEDAKDEEGETPRKLAAAAKPV